MRSHLRLRYARLGWLALLIILGAACESRNSPTQPSQVTVFKPPTDPTQFGVRIAGRAFDQDSKGAIAGAVVSITEVGMPGRADTATGMPQTTTAASGEFAFNVNLPDGWRGVELSLTAPGYEPAYVWVSADNISAAVLPVYSTVILRAGQTSPEANISLGHYVCGWESYWCRRFVVEAEPGELVDVEVTSVSGSLVGLIPTDEPYPFSGYHTSLTVPAGPIWMIGGPSTVTLTARRHQ